MTASPSPTRAKREAQHCDALIGRTASPIDHAKEFAGFVGRMVNHLQPEIARICDDRGVEILVEELTAPEEAEMASASVGAFYGLLQDRHGIYVCTPATDLMAQLDRILGGSGEFAGELTALPASGDRFAKQFENSVLQALRNASGRSDFRVAKRGADLGDSHPLAQADGLHGARLTVRRPSASDWSIELMTCETSITEIVGSRVASPAKGKSISERGLAGSAIAEMELPLQAVLVEMPVAISRLANLKPGSLLPISVQRNVPLFADKTPIAHGTIGEVDDRVSLQISNVFARSTQS